MSRKVAHRSLTDGSTTDGDDGTRRAVAASRRGYRYARKRAADLPRLTVDRAPLDRAHGTAVPAAVRRILVCHLSCPCLARPVSLRCPGGEICSSSVLCPGRNRFPGGAARTALYQGGTARLSCVFAPEVRDPTPSAFGRANAPARGVSLVNGPADQLSGAATLQSAPRPGTRGPVEPFS